MAGDSLRASAPAAAPSEGMPLSPVFTFKHHAPTHGDLHSATASIPGDERGALAVSADRHKKVILSRHAAGLYVSLDLTPEQARAVGAELIAAANALEPHEDAKAGALALLPELTTPEPERRKLAAGLLFNLSRSEKLIEHGNEEVMQRLAYLAADIGVELEAPEDIQTRLRSLLELAELPVSPIKGRNRELRMRMTQEQRERIALMARAALLLIEQAAPATPKREG